MSKKKPSRPQTVSPEIAEQWAALAGATVTETEHLEFHDPVLYPELPSVEVDVDRITPLFVPPRLLPATCPECDGPADLSAADPLALIHLDERCEVAADEAELKRSDLRRLARVGAHGLDRKHRIAADVEHRIIEERGLTLPPGAFTVVTAVGTDDRARSWSALKHEPALQPRTWN